MLYIMEMIGVPHSVEDMIFIFVIIFLNNNSSSNINHSYQDVLGKGNSIFSGDINNRNFKLKELEVFKLFK